MFESTGWGEQIPWTEYPTNDWPDGSTRTYSPLATIHDRADGKLFPIYETEVDLARQIASVRRFIGLSELCQAARTALRVYTFGSGAETSVRAALKADVPPELVDDVRRIVETFVEDNGIVNGVDLDLHDRAREDGEAILPIERYGNSIRCQFVETVQLSEPASPRSLHDYIDAAHGVDCESFVPSWLFGVLTTRRDTSTPLGYHVVYDSTGSDWEFYTPSKLVHAKRNVPRSAKRGVSDWLPNRDRVLQHLKLVKNLAHGTALQAAIAWVEESPTGTSSGQLASIGSTGQGRMLSNGPGSSYQERTKQYTAGSIIRPTPGRQYKPFLQGSDHNAGFAAIEQMLARLVGVPWLMTYSLISGDPSNNNFASSLVAESPFVKAREADQEWFGGVLKSLYWKVVQFAWELGWLDTRGIPFRQLSKLIDIKVDFVSPATRDRGALVNQLKTEVGLGVTSLRTAAVQLDRDYDEEVASGAAPMGGQPQAVYDGQPTTTTDAGGNVASVADAALNGAQIASLMDILDAVTSKRIPTATALATMQAAFPSLGSDVLNGILNPLVGYVSPILADGSINPAASPAETTGATGEMANLSTQQFNRNTKAIRKILDAFIAGGSRVIAKGMLTALSIPDAKAEEYIDDAAKDGTIDSPDLNPTQSAALQGALESVESTDEARQILEDMNRAYP